MAVTRNNLLEFLQGSLGVDVAELETDDTELYSSGLVDSFSIVHLIQFLEAQGGFEVDPTDVNLENLDSIRKILAYASTQARA